MSGEKKRPISDGLTVWQRALFARRIRSDRLRFAEIARDQLGELAQDAPSIAPTAVAERESQPAANRSRARFSGRRIAVLASVALAGGAGGYLVASGTTDKPKPEAFQAADIEFQTRRAALKSPAALGATATCAAELQITADWLTLEATHNRPHLTYPSPAEYAEAAKLATGNVPCALPQGQLAATTLWVGLPNGKKVTGTLTADELIPYDFRVENSCDLLARNSLDGYATFLAQPATGATDENLVHYNGYLARTQAYCTTQLAPTPR